VETVTGNDSRFVHRTNIPTVMVTTCGTNPSGVIMTMVVSEKSGVPVAVGAGVSVTVGVPVALVAAVDVLVGLSVAVALGVAELVGVLDGPVGKGLAVLVGDVVAVGDGPASSTMMVPVGLDTLSMMYM
jgi:hypothetical protein